MHDTRRTINIVTNTNTNGIGQKIEVFFREVATRYGYRKLKDYQFVNMYQILLLKESVINNYLFLRFSREDSRASTSSQI